MRNHMMRLAWLFLPPLLLTVGLTWSAEVHRKDGGYYIYLPPSVAFEHVLDRLKTEIEAHNWEVLRVQDIDAGLKEHYKMDIQNKVVYACKSQYLAQAIEEDPNISMLVPCRFAIYRVDYAGKAGGAASDGGRIVVGVADPVREADALGIQRREAASIAAKELKAILSAVADFFAKK